MKKDAYYFSHDANAQDDPKCMVLIDQLGMEGYGIFWALIEKLRSEANYKLPLAITGSLARRWGTSKEKVDTVITKYGLFVLEDTTFFSLRLQRSMEERSAKARESALSRWQNANALPPHSDRIANGMRNDANKGKERKGKKSNYSPPTGEALDKRIEELKGYYNEQVSKHKGEPELPAYKRMIKHLYGTNESEKVYRNILSMFSQVTFPEFKTIEKTSAVTGISAEEIFDEMENYKELPYKNLSVAATAINWMRRNAKKAA
jgi:hypothetical protein